MSEEKMEKIGNLTDDELRDVREYRKEEDELTFKIGQRQREIMALSIAAGEVRQRSLELMNTVRKRHDVDDGVLIKLDFNGEIFRVIE